MVRLTGICLNTAFRTKFNYPDKTILQWFPGHMGKGLKQMEQKLKTVDCVIEVHDARVPLSGRNPKFKNTILGLKPHVLVLNKKDLAELNCKNEIENKLYKEGISNIIYTNCKNQKCEGVKSLVPKVKELILKSNRHNRSEAGDFSVMVIGIPNVGKSSLINTLRNRFLQKSNAAAVGAIAGITRSVTTKVKICQDPLIYILDTPGILDPNIKDLDTGLKLALCSTMQDHLVGPRTIADYLLYSMNSEKNFSYVKYLGLEEPLDDITSVLILTAVKLNKIVKLLNLEGGYTLQPDLDYAANYFIKGFRNGEFGKVMLDKAILN